MAALGAVGAMAAGAAGDPRGVRAAAASGESASFADTLKNALGEVSSLQEGARDAISAFVRGEPVEIHEVMAAVEEAGITLDLLIEIRNKLTEAYRSVMQMQS